MYSEIISALEEAEKNPDVLLCCFTGSGNYFSSGNDLKNYTEAGNEEPEKMIKKGCDLVEYVTHI